MNDWFDAESLVEQAHEAFDQGRWEDAESALRRALALDPYRSEWHFNLGLTLEAAGHHGRASTAFRDAHNLNPEDPHSALYCGLNLLKENKPKQSIEWFNKASALDPSLPAPYVHRIEAYTDLEDHENAELMFFMGQQVTTEDAGLYTAMADSLLERELFDKAVWCLREATRLDPDMPGVHGRLAEAYARTGRLERARQLYLRALRQDPGDVDALLDLGKVLLDMNRVSEAAEKYRRVLELEPDNADAHFALGELAERQNSPKEAIAQYDVVFRLDPAFPGVRRRLAALLMRRKADGDTEHALELLDRELHDLGTGLTIDPDAATELAQLLLDADPDQPGPAIDLLRRVVAMRQNNPESWHLLSLACFAAGDRAAGVDACKQVLRLNPRHVRAMHNIAVAAVHDRQWRRARYWAGQALRIDPDDTYLRRLRFKLALRSAREWARFAGKAASAVASRAIPARTRRRSR